MYESTPQHIIDEEATPGPVAGWLESSSDSSSSSSSDDSSDSEHSRETVSKRMKRAIRGQRRRKSSVVSADTSENVSTGRTRTPSFSTMDASPIPDEFPFEGPSARPRGFASLHAGGSPAGHDDDAEEDHQTRHKRHHKRGSKKHRKHKHHRHESRRNPSYEDTGDQTTDQNVPAQRVSTLSPGEPRRVDFAATHSNPQEQDTAEASPSRRPFTGLRSMSIRPVAKSLAPSVFLQPQDVATPAAPSGPVPRVRYGIRRTNSLPERLSQYYRPPGAMMPSQIPMAATAADGTLAAKAEEHPDHLSRTSAVLLLLCSTGLVAVCAEFMVDSINGLVASSSVGEIFIGLIILPIVGNAAEHVTAITVAMKNKMDLAIGVAVGSSIQIALFITPLVVIIGWAMDKNMTLYFTLFETVCLFVSTFIVNFLVLDGRSNYLEGALLCATYVIIGLVAFFYPAEGEVSSWGA